MALPKTQPVLTACRAAHLQDPLLRSQGIIVTLHWVPTPEDLYVCRQVFVVFTGFARRRGDLISVEWYRRHHHQILLAGSRVVLRR